MNKELETLIEKVVEDKTFTVEAVEGIKNLRNENVTLLEKIGVLEKNLKLHVNITTDDSRQIAQLKADLKSELDNRVANQDLVNSAQELKTQKLVAQATASAFKEAMQIVFKPTVLRESILSNSTGTGNVFGNETKNQTKLTEKD